jgi:nitronate monooxygenase
MWPDRRLLDLFGIEHPIVQAPMANSSDVEIAVAVAQAGGLGSLPAGSLDAERLREHVTAFRAGAPGRPVNVNFFAHRIPTPNNAREAAWREALKSYYVEYGIDPNAPVTSIQRAPFNASHCKVVEALKPEVVSFHYGLPPPHLLARVKTFRARPPPPPTTARSRPYPSSWRRAGQAPQKRAEIRARAR